jgi:ATP-binding cassette subfamily F protein 3
MSSFDFPLLSSLIRSFVSENVDESMVEYALNCAENSDFSDLKDALSVLVDGGALTEAQLDEAVAGAGARGGDGRGGDGGDGGDGGGVGRAGLGATGEGAASVRALGVKVRIADSETPTRPLEWYASVRRDDGVSELFEAKKKAGEVPVDRLKSNADLAAEAGRRNEVGESRVETRPSRFKQDALTTKREVSVEGLKLGYGRGIDLLVDAHLKLSPGFIYGLVGRNGSGKTTLMKAIARRQITGFPAGLTCLYVEQEGVVFADTPVACVVAGDARLAAARAREKELLGGKADGAASSSDAAAGAELTQLFEELDFLGSATAELRATSILRGLGFTDEYLSRPVDALSGGWRMRLVLARALFCPPDVLLLDEPTNHLDLPAMLWVQKFLTSLTNTAVLCVSHDRNFLNDIATCIVELKNKTLRYFPGDYEAYLVASGDLALQQQRAFESLAKKRQLIEESIARQRVQANRHNDDKLLGQIASRKKKLERLGMEKDAHGHRLKVSNEGERKQVEAVAEEEVLRFSLPSALPISYNGPTLQLSDVTFRYPGTARDIVADVELDITPDARIGLIGGNGGGKSTLLKLIHGDLEPTSGAIKRHPHLRFAFFTQHHVDQLDLDLTPLQFLMRTSGQLEGICRAHLGTLGLKDLVHQRIGLLSGGEKSRVVFANLTMTAPHVLILDEPTNHLDQDTVESLIAAVDDFAGAVIVVTHDLHFVKVLCDDIYAIHSGTGRLRRLEGDEGLEAYINEVKKSVAQL